ncbi:MAG: hypothetical protein FWH27_00850 [Planctomycetaceae bacterium]|nr:hypothetical protein [Planctomycetaceae bacterium]
MGDQVEVFQLDFPVTKGVSPYSLSNTGKLRQLHVPVASVSMINFAIFGRLVAIKTCHEAESPRFWKTRTCVAADVFARLLRWWHELLRWWHWRSNDWPLATRH